MWNQNQHLFFRLLPSLQQGSALGPLEPTIFVFVLILPSNIPGWIDILYCAVSSFLNTKNTDSKKSVMTSAGNSQFNSVLCEGVPLLNRQPADVFEESCIWGASERSWVLSFFMTHMILRLPYLLSLWLLKNVFPFSYSLTITLPLIVLAFPLDTWPSCVIHIVTQGMRTKVFTLRPQHIVSECCFSISASSFKSFCHSFLPSAFFLNI